MPKKVRWHDERRDGWMQQMHEWTLYCRQGRDGNWLDGWR